MATQQEIMQSFERQINFIRDQLIRGEYKNAIDSAELFAKYLSVKVKEIDKKECE